MVSANTVAGPKAINFRQINTHHLTKWAANRINRGLPHQAEWRETAGVQRVDNVLVGSGT